MIQLSFQALECVTNQYRAQQTRFITATKLVEFVHAQVEQDMFFMLIGKTVASIASQTGAQQLIVGRDEAVTCRTSRRRRADWSD